MHKNHTYCFETGDGKNQFLLGIKGANLCELTQLGVNVPPGFVISSDVSRNFFETSLLPSSLMDEISAQITKIETQTGKTFGGDTDPLLISMRFSSAIPETAKMECLLNMGLNSVTIAGLLEATDDPRFVYDTYRRFIHTFSALVLGIADEKFTQQFNQVKTAAGIKIDTALTSIQLEDICYRYLEIVQKETGQAFPEDVFQQIQMAIIAGYNHWQATSATEQLSVSSLRANTVITPAITIVTMVFGNLGDDCAIGHCTTRNPISGVDELYGEYLLNAHGEDVAKGIRSPKQVENLKLENIDHYTQLISLRHKLEVYYQDVQSFEFTVERGILYCLQTCKAELSVTAMVKTSFEMVKQGLITQTQALLRINPETLETLLHPQLINGEQKALTKGIAASPGAVSGQCVFDASSAVRIAKPGVSVILLREETKPDDLPGFQVSAGILTSRGGKTSHAAVITRGMGVPCVVGADNIKIDSKARIAIIGGLRIKEGDEITIDGCTGLIYAGSIRTQSPSYSSALKTLLNWADNIASLKVLANADTPETAELALRYGAKGIGLCRTERMFNGSDRLPIMIEMILASTTKEREDALAKLFPIQRDDFETMLATLSPHSLTIRLLDPPMHEFLPNEQQLLEEIDALQYFLKMSQGQRIAQETLGQYELCSHQEKGLTENAMSGALRKKFLMLDKVRELSEVNPMLGHRGVRLGISYPEIYAMQIRSILEASARCLKRRIPVNPEIMVPQVITAQELILIKTQVLQIQKEVEDLYKVKLNFKFGTMIETVRACTRADMMAGSAEFFSFGTNDLTQATFSFSREDAENKFLPLYQQTGLLENDPFESLDIKGVGKLMEMAVSLGRTQRPDLKVGICGEHGGHPQSVYYCHDIGLDYVSCSAPRIPIARLAAAQAQLLNPR